MVPRLAASGVNSRLYIGNLSPEIGEEDLRALFSQTGTVAEITLVRDPATQQPRGSAYVTMATPEAATEAMENLHSFNLGGRNITVTPARPPQEPKGLMREGFEQVRPSFSRADTRRNHPRHRRRRR